MISDQVPLIVPNLKFSDHRGEFSRIFDLDQNSTGVTQPHKIAQVNISVNPAKYTLRGMHFQVGGPKEHKYISVVSGSIFLVASNAHLIPSRNELRNFEINLTSTDSITLFVPSGWATGWISLENNSTILYLMTARFEECSYGGFRYNDPAAQISWPAMPEVISDKDLNWDKLN
jgi:dTDP-4-dehydrorhamnose 3,5-epimerase